MTAQSLKRKKLQTQAGFVRQAIHSDRLEGIVKIPRNLKNRMLEVILLPFDTGTLFRHSQKAAGSPLEKYAGAWVGGPLVREEDGQYEVREELK